MPDNKKSVKPGKPTSRTSRNRRKMDFPAAGEIASRSNSLDWSGFFGFLPNPDPVLKSVGQDINVYRELLCDAHLTAVINSRKAYTLSKKWSIDRKESPVAVVEAVEEMFERIDVHSATSNILDAFLYGYSPLEIMWDKPVDGIIFPFEFKGKPPEWFLYQEDNILRFRSRDAGFEGMDLPKFKFITARHQSSYWNPYGESLLSRCFWPVNFKKGSYKFWVDYTEKYGSPFAIGKVGRDKGQPEFDKMADMLQNLVNGSVAAIPDDGDIEFITGPANSGSSRLYKDILDFSNAEVSKAILGQTLTTEAGDKGARSLGDVHNEIRGDISEADEIMTEACYDQLIKWFVQINFGENTPLPKFTFDHEDAVHSDIAERDSKLKDQGVVFNKEYYTNTYNLDPDEFEIKEPEEPIDTDPKQKKKKVEGKDDEGDEKSFAETLTPKAQQAIDALNADKITPDNMKEITNNIEEIINIFSEATSLESGLSDVLSKFNKITPDESFINEFGRSLFVSEIWGRLNNAEE